MYIPATDSRKQRRHDLDGLRIIAFGLLILYHVGMYYVADWGWHIKSPEPSFTLQNLMLLTNPWRMSLLFFVSGAALFFASRSIGPLVLVQLRNRRLLLPLLFGMAVIVPPQLYVELRTAEGMAPGYGQFYSMYLDTHTTLYPQYQHAPLGLLTWNHLWFLAYLWVYTLLFVLVKPLLDRGAGWLQLKRPGWLWILLVPVLLLTVVRIALGEAYPPNNALVGDWYNHARYLAFLFGGYLLANCAGFWERIAERAWWLLLGAVASYLGILLIFHGQLPVWLPGLNGGQQWMLTRLLVSVDQWLWLLAVLALGHRYLNRPSRVARYMNDAILPWYMLHQTLIVVAAYSLVSLALPRGIEAAVLVLVTVVGCALGYELVKRFRLTRVLFGLKTVRPTVNAASALPTGPGVSVLPSGSAPGG